MNEELSIQLVSSWIEGSYLGMALYTHNWAENTGMHWFLHFPAVFSLFILELTGMRRVPANYSTCHLRGLAVLKILGSASLYSLFITVLFFPTYYNSLFSLLYLFHASSSQFSLISPDSQFCLRSVQSLPQKLQLMKLQLNFSNLLKLFFSETLSANHCLPCLSVSCPRGPPTGSWQ